VARGRPATNVSTRPTPPRQAFEQKAGCHLAAWAALVRESVHETDSGSPNILWNLHRLALLKIEKHAFEFCAHSDYAAAGVCQAMPEGRRFVAKLDDRRLQNDEVTRV
jgi:hypothetical protein